MKTTPGPAAPEERGGGRVSSVQTGLLLGFGKAVNLAI